MNAPILRSRLRVVEANLADPGVCCRIDAWVYAHPDSTPFHLTAWQKAVEDGCGQQAIYLLVENSFNEISGVLPLHLIHSPLFGRALVSSGFAVGGGVLSTSKTASDKLFAAMTAFAEKWSCSSLELRGGSLPSDRNGSGWIIKRDAHANFKRPLCTDPELELLAIPKRQRADIRKGLEKGLPVVTGRSEQDIDWHYAMYAESVRNLGTPVFPASLFKAVMHHFGENADIITALQDGKPISSVLSLYHKDSVMPYWGGGLWAARKLHANEMLYYSLMNHARDRGCTEFDFGRSKVDSGPYQFKSHWGFVPEPLSYAIRTADGSEPRDINPNSPKYRTQIALWKKLPLPIANRVGPWISRGLG